VLKIALVLFIVFITMEDYKRARLMIVVPVVVVFRPTTSFEVQFSSYIFRLFAHLLHLQ